ncbi:MAG: thioredoxin family protein [Planctomycetota bacterium]
MERIRTYKPDEVTVAVQQNEALLLLHFGSALASSCELIHRQLQSLAPVFEGRVEFAEVELPLQDLELIQRFGIEDVPTLVLFQGSEEVERFDSVQTTEALNDFLEAAVSFYGSFSGSDDPEDPVE